eukprot:UN11923
MWVGGIDLDEESKPWEINQLLTELQIFRKAAKHNNRYFIDNHMTLINPPDDLNYYSPFWRKPEKWVNFQNISITGFNRIYEYDSIYNLLHYALYSHCDVKHFKGYLLNMNITNIAHGHKMHRFGKQENEYVMKYGIMKFLEDIGAKI